MQYMQYMQNMQNMQNMHIAQVVSSASKWSDEARKAIKDHDMSCLKKPVVGKETKLPKEKKNMTKEKTERVSYIDTERLLLIHT